MKVVSCAILIILSSCNTIENLDVLNFDNCKQLNGKEIIREDNINSIVSKKNRIITFNYDSKSNFMSIYNDSTYQLEYRGLFYGRGENEFLSVLSTDYVSINKDNDDMSFLVFDNIKSKYHMINIDESIRENKCKIDFSINCERGNNNHRILNDTLALRLNVENRTYYLFNYITNTLIDSLIFFEKNWNKKNSSCLSNSCIYNADKKRFFVFYHKINRIMSCNYNCDDKRDYATNKKLINYNKLQNFDNSLLVKRYYMDCAYDSNYVYLLCADMSLDEYDNNPKSITIDVFDWFATPIVKYQIAEPLSTLTLDADKNTLYGTTYSGQLFKYKLPNL